MMQDALSKSQYDIVKEIAEILTIIDQHENGESYSLLTLNCSSN